MHSKINIHKRFFHSLFLIFSLFITLPAKSVSVQHEEQDTLIHTAEGIENVNAHPANKEEEVDITAVAFEHILDSHSWHLWGEGHNAVTIPLPVIVKGKNGFVCFMSSEFHHDVHGTVVVEKNGERFVNFEDNIYFASETPNEHGQYVEEKVSDKGGVEILNEVPLDFSLQKT